jgi:hypothetical protein
MMLKFEAYQGLLITLREPRAASSEMPIKTVLEPFSGPACPTVSGGPASSGT